MRRITVILVAVAVCACDKGEAPKAPTPAAAEKVAAEAKKEPEPEPEVEEVHFVTGTTSIKKIASDDRRIEDPAGKAKKKVSNWVATLDRGEKVTVTKAEGEWVHVRASDESEGWLKKKSLLRAADAELATVLDPAKVFKRPELLSLDGSKTIDAGSLLFVLRAKNQFSLVDYPRSAYSGAEVWTLTEGLTADENEVAAAKMVMKIRHLRTKKDPTAKQLEELARSQFSGSQLLKLLEEESAEAAAEAKAQEAEAAGSDDEGADKPEPEAGEEKDG